jgi:hypothetical protein
MIVRLDGTRYKSNIIVQNSNNSTVVEAANALFNKHPDTSIIVKFDQNGNLAIGIISRIITFQVATYKAGASYCCCNWV